MPRAVKDTKSAKPAQKAAATQKATPAKKAAAPAKKVTKTEEAANAVGFDLPLFTVLVTQLKQPDEHAKQVTERTYVPCSVGSGLQGCQVAFNI